MPEDKVPAAPQELVKPEPAHPGDIIQVTDKRHAAFPAILLLHEVRAAHVEAGGVPPVGYFPLGPFRLKPGQFVVVGAAHLLTPDLNAARNASMETAALLARESSPAAPPAK